jgi:hypothetical protein
MNTDFWAAIAAALNNRSSLVWILAILALLTWVAWHTNETLLLIPSRGARDGKVSVRRSHLAKIASPRHVTADAT